MKRSLIKSIFCSVFFLAIAFPALGQTSAFSENAISRPAGFLRIPLQKGFNLISIPLQSFDGDDSINAVLGNQLSGSTNDATADRVLKYDPLSVNYVEALKADGTGNPDIDGKWFASFDGWKPSDMTLQIGEGFWIENRQVDDQVVFLTGEVVLDPTNEILLLPSVSLFGYPYSTAIDLDETGLWQLWTDEGQFDNTGTVDEISDPLADGVDSVTLRLGRAYWYKRNSQDSIVWSEVRPYSDIFPDKDRPPTISGVTVLEDGPVVSLLIQGVIGEQLDIFFQDVSPTKRFDTTTGWMLAAANLPVDNSPIIKWEDHGGANRSSINDIFGRYYLVLSRTGQDANGQASSAWESNKADDVPESAVISHVDDEVTDLSPASEVFDLLHLIDSAGQETNMQESSIVMSNVVNEVPEFEIMTRIDGWTFPYQNIRVEIRAETISARVIINDNPASRDGFMYYAWVHLEEGKNPITILLTDERGGRNTKTITVSFKAPKRYKPKDDSDGDGVINSLDKFLSDPSESEDSDSDGVGDNRDPDDNNASISRSIIIESPANGKLIGPVPISDFNTGRLVTISGHVLDGATRVTIRVIPHNARQGTERDYTGAVFSGTNFSKEVKLFPGRNQIIVSSSTGVTLEHLLDFEVAPPKLRWGVPWR